jgi:large subunit ribosomal protein L31
MRKGIHPLLKRLTVVNAQGASTSVWSTMSARGGAIFLQSDPTTHPAWTGRKLAIANTGRVAKFRQRFEADATAAAAALKEAQAAKEAGEQKQ